MWESFCIHLQLITLVAETVLHSCLPFKQDKTHPVHRTRFWGGKILCTSHWVACTIFFWSRMARKFEVGFQVGITCGSRWFVSGWNHLWQSLHVLVNATVRLGGGNRNGTPHGLEMLVFAFLSQPVCVFLSSYVHGRLVAFL